MYFRDETIELKIDVDNSKCSQSIDNIEVTLRQIIDARTDRNSGYKSGTGKYNKEYTTVYDLSRRNFGMLKKGENSDQLVASFNIVEVMDELYTIKEKLRG